MHVSRKLAALGIAGVAAISSWGVYATTLAITDHSGFAAGTVDLTAGCDTAVTTTASPTLDADGRFVISAVTVSDVNSLACDFQDLTVYALDSNREIVAYAHEYVDGISEDGTISSYTMTVSTHDMWSALPAQPVLATAVTSWAVSFTPLGVDINQ